MRAIESLPEGYTKIYSVDLQKDKKAKVGINLFAVLLGVLLAVPAHIAVPISTLFSMEEGLSNYALRFGALIVLSVLYIILHELIHGAAMKLCGTKRVKYGFTGLYAFAGSDDYYGKGAYIFIAQAPVVLWGAVLAVVNFLVPLSWFWVVYIIQIMNLSGAAGDFFVTARFLKMPKDILVRDVGVGMTVYSRSRAE